MDEPRHITYYNTQARLRKEFLHPGGKSATETLISQLPALTEDSVVLELGCGVGTTGKLLLKRSSCRYVGLDASPLMVYRARSRLGSYKERALVLRCDLKEREIPLISNSIDAIVAESVVAMLRPREIIGECYRVLKRSGVLALNDRIWGEMITPEERSRVNDLCRKNYGIRAAPEELATAAKWQNLLKAVGFEIVALQRLQQQGEDNSLSWSTGLRRLRNGWAMVVHPSTIATYIQDRKVAHQYSDIWKKMENWIFIARKK